MIVNSVWWGEILLRPKEGHWSRKMMAYIAAPNFSIGASEYF
jgi:hypothetical protein